jgi:hypothetical protein
LVGVTGLNPLLSPILPQLPLAVNIVLPFRLSPLVRCAFCNAVGTGLPSVAEVFGGGQLSTLATVREDRDESTVLAVEAGEDLSPNFGI